MNLFATVLTYPAPSANYRGESELNRSVIQKVTDGRFDYPIFSPESMRNALREILAGEGTDFPATASGFIPSQGRENPTMAARATSSNSPSGTLSTPIPTTTSTTSSSATCWP